MEEHEPKFQSISVLHFPQKRTASMHTTLSANIASSQ